MCQTSHLNTHTQTQTHAYTLRSVNVNINHFVPLCFKMFVIFSTTTQEVGPT